MREKGEAVEQILSRGGPGPLVSWDVGRTGRGVDVWTLGAD